MSKLTIRMIAAQDYHEIHELNCQLGYEYAEDKVYKRIISILEAGSDILLVADVDGDVVGYAHGAPYETLYSDNLLNTICFCVKHTIENQAEVANALYMEFEARAKRFGFSGIRLVVDQEREDAQQLFMQHGFQTNRSQKHFIKYF